MKKKEIQESNQIPQKVEVVANTPLANSLKNLRPYQNVPAMLSIVKSKLAGRKTKLTERFAKKVFETIAVGKLPKYRAALSLGIRPTTLADWEKEIPDFSEFIAEAERIRDESISESAEVNVVGAVEEEKDLESSEWWLERRKPHKFGKNNGAGVNVQVNAVFS